MLNRFTFFNCKYNKFPEVIIRTTDAWLLTGWVPQDPQISQFIQSLHKKGLKVCLIPETPVIPDIRGADYLIWRGSFGLLFEILEYTRSVGSKLILIEDTSLDKASLLQQNQSIQFSLLLDFKAACQEIWIAGQPNLQNAESGKLTDLFNIPISYGILSCPSSSVIPLFQEIREMLLQKDPEKYPARFFYILELIEPCLFERGIPPVDTPAGAYHSDGFFWITLRASLRADNESVTPKFGSPGSLVLLYKVTDFFKEDRLSEFMVTELGHRALRQLFQDFGIDLTKLTQVGHDLFYDQKKLYSGEDWKDSAKNYGTAGIAQIHFNESSEHKFWQQTNSTPKHSVIGLMDINAQFTPAVVEWYLLQEIKRTIENTF